MINIKILWFSEVNSLLLSSSDVLTLRRVACYPFTLLIAKAWLFFFLGESPGVCFGLFRFILFLPAVYFPLLPIAPALPREPFWELHSSIKTKPVQREAKVNATLKTHNSSTLTSWWRCKNISDREKECSGIPEVNSIIANLFLNSLFS